ncbi:hypothetical protein K439DRAFT_1341913 [Ramaria rubella]|nr:hypothetical protein K439DRAFT_1341913 [Ramaria rubella]
MPPYAPWRSRISAPSSWSSSRRQSNARSTRALAPGSSLPAPQAEAAFRAGEAECTAKEALDAAKQAEKEAIEHACELQRAQNTILKTYNTPLTSYKRKDDLKDIMASCALPQTGMIAELMAQCQEHLTQNPHLENNPRFTGLFVTHWARRRPANDSTPHKDIPGVPECLPLPPHAVAGASNIAAPTPLPHPHPPSLPPQSHQLPGRTPLCPPCLFSVPFPLLCMPPLAH